jgi:hypothetical protein
MYQERRMATEFGFAQKLFYARRFLTQRRKDAKRCRVFEGFPLRLCAFA